MIQCNNFGTDEFFIDKAIGRSLRDRQNRSRTGWAFIDRYRERMARLSLREAGKLL